MDDRNSKKGKPEGGASVDGEQRNVIMGMEILHCSVCGDPLRPEVFQCSCGRFICKNCYETPSKTVCSTCSGPFSQRAHGMERILANIVFPCKYECGVTAGSCYENKQHETDCPRGPALCPADECEFEAPKAALLDHLSTVHKCLTTIFMYDVEFLLLALPGYRLLRNEDDIFLLNVSDSLINGHRAVYVDLVGRSDANIYEFGCSVSVTWENRDRTRHCRSGRCDDITLRDDEEHRLCIFPRCSNLVLKITLNKT